MMTKQRVFEALAFTLLGLALVLGGSYVYSVFFESPWLYYKNMPFHVNGTVFPGGPAMSPVLRCSSAKKTQAYSTTRNFQRMGGTLAPIMLPSLNLSVEPGCEPAISRINIVPDNTVPGWYRFYGKASIHGLFAVHEVDWTTDFFEVIDRPVKEHDITVEVKP